MNLLNNSLVTTGAGVEAGTGEKIKVGTRSGPGVELRDGAGEVLPE